MKKITLLLALLLNVATSKTMAQEETVLWSSDSPVLSNWNEDVIVEASSCKNLFPGDVLTIYISSFSETGGHNIGFASKDQSWLYVELQSTYVNEGDATQSTYSFTLTQNSVNYMQYHGFFLRCNDAYVNKITVTTPANTVNLSDPDNGWDASFDTETKVITYNDSWKGWGWWIGGSLTDYASVTVNFGGNSGAEMNGQLKISYKDPSEEESVDFKSGDTSVTLPLNATYKNDVNRIYLANETAGTLTLSTVYYTANPRAYNIEIGSTGYATAYFPSAVSLPSGIAVYAGASYTNGDETITLYDITDENTELPAGSAVILKGTAGQTYSFPLITSTSSTVWSSLNGCTIAETQNTDYTYYVLANKESGIGLYPLKSTETLPANKAYLKVKNSVESKSRLFLSFSFNDEVTGIETVTASENVGKESVMYDVMGRIISNTSNPRGFVIKNGRKYFYK